MANVLPREKQLMVLRMLVEGNSIRSIERMTGVRKRTITNLLVRFGKQCDNFLDDRLRNIEKKTSSWTSSGRGSEKSRAT